MYKIYNYKCVRPPGRTLTILLFFTVFLHLSTGTFAQKVTLSEKKAPLKVVIEKISRQSGFDFLVATEDLKLAKPVTIVVQNEELKSALQKIFAGQPLTYSIQEKTVVVSRKFNPKRAADIPIKVMGTVTDTTGTPLVGATIKIRGSEITALSDSTGTFSILAQASDKIDISYIGFAVYSFELSVEQPFQKIILRTAASKLTEVNVVSTGYQILPRERATGSFVQINNKLLNRSVSTNILDRLDGVTSGLIFNKNTNGITDNASIITIRGRSTIYANPNPLIVVDNFPYNGDLSSINPNDVESVTILKDAAAASIWGAFSGNGVIVITTKKGKRNQPAKIEFNSNVTIGDKPNLWYAPRLSSSDYIAVEQYLFKQGFYDNALSSITYPVVSPVVELLDKRKNGLITPLDSAKAINQYKRQDTRDDISKYLYRKSVNQQYDLSISGGGDNNTYYFSSGFDKNLNSLQRNDFDRISLNGANTYSFLNKKLEITTGIYFTKNTTHNNGLSSLGFTYPYIKLKDQNGNAASVPYQYRQGYVDTAGHGNLLDWNYRPLDELGLNNNTTRLTEYRINAGIRYNFFNGFNGTVLYQYDQGNSDQQIRYSSQSYYVRNYINQFTQYDPTSNTYTRPVPAGDILDRASQTSSSQNIRGQITYNHGWSAGNSLSAIAGVEVRDVNTDYSSNRVYGYSDLGADAAIDYKTTFLLMPSYSTSNISSNLSQLGTTNRFVSYFTNMAYSFERRFIVSASARKDEANVFGVNSNQKGLPLWSLGASWKLNDEHFYHLSWLPYLRLRITTGYQGNVDNALSSLVTATINPQTINNYQQPYSTLANPPNPQLRWEKVNTTNLGADFSFIRALSGSVEYYIKKGTDLIGTSLVDPTTGVTTFTGNSADMAGRGLDIVLNSTNVNGVFKWTTSFLLSHSTDKVTRYLLKSPGVSNAISSSINPVVGNPLYSLYSFQWGGLDGNGNPQVYLNGKLSTDYSAIYNSPYLSNLQYSGPANPTTFGGVKNDFTWKQFTLSINITYKFGYYFRRPSLNYTRLFSGIVNFPDQDFANRWQKPGDEARTNIPSLIYPANSLRDQVYNYSSNLIDKGDHIRLQDISLGYDLNRRQLPRLPFSNIRVYAYANNLGILWRANKDKIDPDYVPYGSAIYPNPKTYAVGVKCSF